MGVFGDAGVGVDGVFIEAEAHLVAANAAEDGELVVDAGFPAGGGAAGAECVVVVVVAAGGLHPAVNLVTEVHTGVVVEDVLVSADSGHGGHYFGAKTSVSYHR